MAHQHNSCSCSEMPFVGLELLREFSQTIVPEKCSCEKHVIYDVSRQKILVDNLDDVRMVFPELNRDVMSPMKKVSLIDGEKEDMDLQFVMAVNMPDDIASLECPEDGKCKHFHLHALDTCYQTVYFTLVPAPPCSGHPELWWLVEIQVHMVAQEMIDVEDNRCHNQNRKRDGPGIPNRIQSPRKRSRRHEPPFSLKIDGEKDGSPAPMAPKDGPAEDPRSPRDNLAEQPHESLNEIAAVVAERKNSDNK